MGSIGGRESDRLAALWWLILIALCLRRSEAAALSRDDLASDAREQRRSSHGDKTDT